MNFLFSTSYDTFCVELTLKNVNLKPSHLESNKLIIHNF